VTLLPLAPYSFINAMLIFKKLKKKLQQVLSVVDTVDQTFPKIYIDRSSTGGNWYCWSTM
jgi:hypothetical protein